MENNKGQNKMKAKILLEIYNAGREAVKEHNFDGKCTEECRQAILGNMERKFEKILEKIEVK